MTDLQTLKKKAEAALMVPGDHPNDYVDQATAQVQFKKAATPRAILALIEELERKTEECKQVRGEWIPPEGWYTV